jgi:MFS family permease
MTSSSVPASTAVPGSAPSRPRRRTELAAYPSGGRRYLCLAIVVVATIVLYYQFYLAGAVAAGTGGKNGILVDYNMSFVYYVNIAVVGYVLGAIASFMTGFADRVGRVNIVTVGLAIVALLCLVGIPLADSKLGFGFVFAAIGLVEGVILVATPALIRDFSPQLGRASAMGFWTLGPVLGSLVVSVQISNTSNSTPWHHQYVAAGIVGLVIAALSALFLRELTPELRDQVMVTARDRALIEARAAGIDVEAAQRHPFRQMLKPDIIGSAFAISVFLIIYYLAVGYFPIYFQTIFGFSQSKANALGNWNWAFNAGALIVVGALSDFVRVRKPFMIVGALGAILFTSLFALRATHPLTSYGTFVWLLIGISVSLGVAYAPWMASFTETVEKRNPALTATGLAVWGLVIRIVIAITVFFVPHVVNTATTLVEHGAPIATVKAQVDAAHPGLIDSLQKHPDVVAKVGAISAKDKDVIAAVQAHPDVVARIQAIQAKEPDVVAKVQANLPLVQQLLPYAKDPSKIPPALLQQAEQALGPTVLAKLADPSVQADLLYLQTTAPATLGPANFAALQKPDVQADLKYLQTTAPQALGKDNFAALQDPTTQRQLAVLNSPTGKKVADAAARSPKQWQHYFWIAVGGEVVFIPLIFLLVGFWSPRRAKQAEQEHEAMVERELARLRS